MRAWAIQPTNITVPVPAWPGLPAYPALVFTITICGISPEIVAPDLLIEPDTMTAIYEGTLLGGSELLPGSVVQVPPQLGGVVLLWLAKPLKLAGALPPLKEFSFDHCAPQKVTELPTTAFRSPIT